MNSKLAIKQLALSVEDLVYYLSNGTGIISHLLNKKYQNPIVLAFHSVQEPFKFGNDFFQVSNPIADFKKAIKFIKANFKIVSLDHLVDQLQSQKSIESNLLAITFDDGYYDNFAFVYPYLKSENLDWTVYLPAAYIGLSKILWTTHIADALYHAKSGAYEFNLPGNDENSKKIEFQLLGINSRKEGCRQLNAYLMCQPYNIIEESLIVLDKLFDHPEISEEANKFRIMDWQDVKYLSDNGVTIGSHGLHHLSMETLPHEDIYEEVYASKRIIEGIVKKEVLHFSYPFGTPGVFGAHSEKLLTEAGYKSSVLHTRGVLDSSTNLYQAPRLAVPINNTLKLKGRLTGITNRINPGMLSTDNKPKTN